MFYPVHHRDCNRRQSAKANSSDCNWIFFLNIADGGTAALFPVGYTRLLITEYHYTVFRSIKTRRQGGQFFYLDMQWCM